MFHSPAIRTIKDTFTGRIISALFFFGSLALAMIDYSDSHSFDPWLWGFTTFFAFLFAFSIYWAAVRRVTIHQEGISYVSPVKRSEMRWEEIAATRYSQTPSSAGLHFGLIGLLAMAATRGKSATFNKALVLEGPTKIKLSSNMADVDEAIRLVLDAVNPRLLKQAEANLATGMPVEFGQLSLTIQGVVWKKKNPIPFASIVKCMIEGANFQLKSEGKWLNDISVAASKIPNVFVAIKMIESRRATVGTPPVSKGMSAGFSS
jgi:hypothetical protein